MKKYLWLLLIGLLPLGLMACSDSDEPKREPVVIDPSEKEPSSEEPEYYTFSEAYINQFCYDQLSYYYLWSNEIANDMKSWKLNEDPIDKVNDIRYEDDRWTAAIENIKPYTEPSATTSGTYGYDFQPMWADDTKTNVVAVVTMVYPGSPAETAGLKRGSIIFQMNGKDIQNTNEDYQKLLSSTSIKLLVMEYNGAKTKTIEMTSKDMYLDPVLYEKVFDCNGKKVGYVFFNDYSFECIDRLLEVAKLFKKEGVTELILDLRYNGGGYVRTEEILASLLAPKENVDKGEVFQTAVYNNSPYSIALEKNYGKDYVNTYFSTKYEWEYKDKKYSYDTSDFNIGLTKIYALVSGSSASASEATLVCLMPYMDVEVIGTQTSGKYCAGVMFEAEEYYQDYEAYVADLKKNDKTKYEKFVDEYWKYYSGWNKYVGNWGLYVMISTYADKNGDNPCRPDGLVPDVEVVDNPVERYQLGDDREALLREALTKAGYVNFTSKPDAESRALNVVCLGESIQKEAEGRMILLKPEVLRNVFSRSLNLE